MRLTDEQRAAAEAPERGVAVVAGAGTGKTRVLTERYVHLVKVRGVEIRRILAVTFTEKAAREMKDRIRAALPPDLARQAEFAPISTIHAFLARILRERALDAALDPRFVIADEITAELILEESLKEAVDGLDGPVRAALVDLQGGERFLRDLYDAARATPFRMEELRPVAADPAELRERLRRFLDACAEQRPTAAGTARKVKALVGLRPRLLVLDPGAAEEFHEAVKGGVAAAQKDLFQEGRALRDEYRLLPWAETARDVGAAVVGALARLDAIYTARKRDQGYLDFADLEREGLRLLRSPVGDEVLAEYDHVLVDEYQDTNRLQEAILDRLAEGCHRFGVGDEKQSIYRFRYADAAVFQELQEEAARYPLGGSFRSRPELVAFNNELFRKLLAKTDVRPQDLRAEAAWEGKEPPCVEVLLPEARDLADGRRKEAQAIARRLREIVEKQELTLTRAGEEQAPLTYAHCALLLRAMSNLVVYERAFAEAGVPYVVIQGRGYYAAREVVDLAHLLMLLADPHDDFRAVAVMTSLLCGVPESDLLALEREGPWPLRALRQDRPATIPEERWRTLRTFGERFRRWRELSGRLETGDLIETILAETRFAELLLLERDGRRRHANLKKALRRARQTTEDYLTYARSLLEFRERELRESEAPIASEEDEAVKIMTVHAAKGLEFPLVVVGDLTAGRRGGSGPLLRPDGVFGFKLRGDDRHGVRPPGYAELREWETAQERAEDLRLLYVAFTRAQEHMILTGARAHTKANGTVLDALPAGVRHVDPGPLLEPDGRRRRNAAVRAAVRRRAPLPRDVARDEAGARALLDRLAGAHLPAVNSKPYVAAVADLVEFERCPRRYRLKRMLGIEFEDHGEGAEPADSEEHPRRELGTAFHELLEEIGPGAVPDEKTIRRHLPAARPADVKKLKKWCRWLQQQEIVGRLEGRLHKEMPFLTRVAGLALRGKIDLYAPAVPLLLDYKTGATARPQEYTAQVAIYLAALRGLGFRAPDRAHLVYVDAEQVVEVEEAPVDGLVRRFIEAHAGDGSFPPQPGGACIHCEFKAACARNGVPVERQPTLF